MFKKISTVSVRLLVLAICCAHLIAFSASKAPKSQEQSLTIHRNNLIAPPISILNARLDAESLSVEAQNISAFVVEYFELQLDSSKVMLGKNSLSEKLTKHPEYAKTPELRFGPGEIRTFRFGAPRSAEKTISIKVVLLMNGQGWFNGVWLKKLDKANERGMLWEVDKQENKRHLKIAFHTNQSRFTSNGLVSRNRQTCWFPVQLIDEECTPPGGACSHFDIEYQQAGSDVQVDFFGHDDCYYPFET